MRLVLLIVLAGISWGRTLEVGAASPFHTFAEAWCASTAGDTIRIHPGTYPVVDLLIDHSIFLQGVGAPILDGQGRGEILKITADDVRIEGIHFQNAGLSFIDDNAALKLDGVSNCSILNNRFTNNFFAIYLARSENTRIRGNRIRSNALTESRSGNGIHLWYCRNIEIEENEIQGHRDGIYLEFVRHCDIQDNLSQANLRYGLHFMFSDSNRYHGNHFESNGAGVAVMYSKHVTMTGNVFKGNWGGASYGLLLKEIYDSEVRGCLFQRNSTGISMEASNRVEIVENTIEENGWGMKVMANCMENEITGNIFRYNSFDVATNSVQNFNHYTENFWQAYRGYDLNRDGIGDIPYRPVKLFSVMTQQNPPALILLHSLFAELLNLSETYLPVFTPASLVDDQPRMEAHP